MLPDLSKDPTQWFPMPAALVTCQPPNGRPNLMGIGYVGFCCWQPPTVCLGINTARYSGEVIRAVKSFVVALPDEEHVLNMDYCGFISGIDRDKFAAAGLTTRPGTRVAAPLINECPVNLECELTGVTPIGKQCGLAVRQADADLKAGFKPLFCRSRALHGAVSKATWAKQPHRRWPERDKGHHGHLTKNPFQIN